MAQCPPNTSLGIWTPCGDVFIEISLVFEIKIAIPKAKTVKKKNVDNFFIYQHGLGIH